MKISALIVLALLPILAGAESSRFDASMTLKVRDVPALLSLLNERLGLRIHEKVLSDYTASIAVGNEYSEGIDVHFRGIVLTVTFRIAKSVIGEIDVSFESFNKELAKAICEQMFESTQMGDSTDAPIACRYDLLETIST